MEYNTTERIVFKLKLKGAYMGITFNGYTSWDTRETAWQLTDTDENILSEAQQDIMKCETYDEIRDVVMRHTRRALKQNNVKYSTIDFSSVNYQQVIDTVLGDLKSITLSDMSTWVESSYIK